jgi:hypothetical protein
MSVESSLKKTVNKVKGTLAQHAGPVRKDQATSPFADAIREVAETV